MPGAFTVGFSAGFDIEDYPVAEIITTRAQIRRSIGRMIRLEFFLRYGGDIPKSVTDPGGDTNTTILVHDSDLTQDTDAWRYDWWYDITLDEERVIMNSSSDGAINLEWALSAASTAGDPYEIWGMWPPSDVHQKINMALRSAWRFFPNVVVNEQIVLREDQMRYGLASTDLSNLDTDQNEPPVAEVLQIYIEQSRDVKLGQITSTTSATVFTDENNEWSTNAAGGVAGTDFLVSFYSGLGSGQLREVTTWDTDGIFTVDTDMDDFDTNTRYAVWDPSTGQFDEWYRLTAAKFDQIENPDEFYLTQLYPAVYGMRFRIIYAAQSTDLAADTDESRVPEEYLVYKALSILYDELVGDNRHDRSSHAGLAEYYDQLAQKFAGDEGRQLPAATIWSEVDVGAAGAFREQGNPMGWSGQGP